MGSVRCFLMLANSIANQGTIFHWARDHRVHHKHTETTADPHGATRGFFYAHVGWLLVKKDKAVVEAGRKLDFSDLKADGFVMFQKRLDPWFTLFMSYLFPGYVARYCWGAEFWSCVWIQVPFGTAPYFTLLGSSTPRHTFTGIIRTTPAAGPQRIHSYLCAR